MQTNTLQVYSSTRLIQRITIRSGSRHAHQYPPELSLRLRLRLGPHWRRTRNCSLEYSSSNLSLGIRILHRTQEPRVLGRFHSCCPQKLGPNVQT